MTNFPIKRLVLALASAVLLSGALTACIPLVIGGAAAGGSLVVTDRRTSGAQLEDEGIELRSSSRLRGNLVERAHINVTSYNRQVLLTGEVPTAEDKQLAGQTVTSVENVASVINELGVLGNSSLVQRSSDVLISGRVKAMLIDAADLYSNSFKVVTERGTTYLMGRVTQREADRGTEVVRSTPGVQKVVRMFEIISQEELSKMLPQSAKPAPSDVKPAASN